jgi:hypothetical protein
MLSTLERPTITHLQDRIDSTVQPLAKKLRVQVTRRGVTWFPESATFRLQLVLTRPDGEVVDEKAEDFKRMARVHGFREDDLGKTFHFNRKPFTLCGWARYSRRYTVLAKNPQGKIYKFAVADIKEALTRADGITRTPNL